MIDVRNNFVGGLNYDDSPLVMPKECYQDALNITRDATAGQHDNVITNIVGNQLRNYTLPSGTNKVIGAFPYRLRSTVIYFVYNSNNHHSILQYSNTTKITTKIFESLLDSSTDILGLTLTGKITSVNVFPRSEDEGDLLFFLDSEGRPTTMNITRFIAGEYTPVTRDIIDVGKRPPLSPPSNIYGNDATHSVNNTRNKFFRFKYRWVYDDFEKSTCSPISAMPMPVNLLDDEYTNLSTNNNRITVAVNSGPKNVAKIELLVSYVDRTNIWSDFAVVESIDKSELSIADNADYAYLFYNDATYPAIDPNESILLFDYVPELANAQEMPNGNVVTYAGITEGIDRDLDANVTITIDTVEAGGGGSTGSLNGVVTITADNALFQQFEIAFSGVPAVGTEIECEVQQVSGGAIFLAATYTTIAGDTATSVAAAMVLSFNSLGQVELAANVGSTVTVLANSPVFTPKRIFYSLTITPPGSDADDNSTATWKWSTQRRLGLAYYNQKGKTNGVLYSTGITFPEYTETTPNVVDLPFINAKIYHVPPIWAYSYQWVITKEPTQYLFWECISVNDTETDYLYFEITNMALNAQKNITTAAVLNWTFADGDRMRLIKRDSDDFIFDDSFDSAIEGIVVDPVINNVATTGTFVKIKQIAPFAAENYSSDFFIIELYRPGQQVATDENEVYYEFGIEYDILNPGTAQRVHAGEVTDQSSNYVTPAEVNMYNGDSYFRVRTVYLSDTGLGTFFVQDRNVVDTYISAVSSVDGRPLVIDINAKRSYFSATGRFGQAYQANTNVNGLNRFYPANFYDCDISYGDIMRLLVNDRRIWVFQKFKTGQLPIFSQINKQPDGTIVNVVTDQLINPIDYYAGNWGIGDASTSLVSHDYVAYYCDNVHGAILRLSKDGQTPISILYKVNSWANENLPLRTNDIFIYGGYDQRLNNYIITLEAAGDSPAQTLTFNEDRNSFESKLSLQPEWMCSLGTLLIAFKNGALWTHDSETYNSFFGVSYESSITFVFNEVSLQKKSWQNITTISNNVWDCPEISTNVNSYGTTKQQSTLVAQEFQLLEGNPSTTIKRDSNSRGGKWNGDFLKGNYIIIKFRKASASSLEYLSMVSVNFNNSPLTKT